MGRFRPIFDVMKYLLAALVMLLPTAASAQPPKQETGPNFNEPSRREVPNPLPPDFDECVVVVWSPAMKARTGENGRVYEPPLSDAARQNIQNGLRLGWGTFHRCESRGA